MPYAYQTGDNCYGRGDYYQGDYYRGDPGLLGGLLKVVKKIAPKVLRGVPFVGTAISAIDIGRSLLPARRVPSPLAPLELPEPGTLPMIPGGMGGGGFGGPPMVMGPNGQLCTVRGTRANKSTYVTRGGGTSRWPQSLIVHPRGTECVKVRRMNVANPRALRRAIRRGRGFIKLSRKAASAFGFTVVSKGSRKAKGKK